MLYLIAKNPEAVSIPLTRSDVAGTTPFHCACQMSNIHIDILKSMLETNVELATKTCTTNKTTALELLWSHYAPQVDDLLPCSILNKMELVLLTAFQKKVPEETQHDDEERNLLLLCAACAVKCPPDYFRMILSNATASLLTEVDRAGNTPLHYAVMNTAGSKKYSAMVIRALLDKERSCAVSSHRQNLHAALHHGGLTWHEGGVKELLYSYPDALTEPESETHLYPFLLASLHSDDDSKNTSNEHLSTTYELLLASPDLVQLGIPAAAS
jgi:ankyrin repeat protein